MIESFDISLLTRCTVYTTYKRNVNTEMSVQKRKFWRFREEDVTNGDNTSELFFGFRQKVPTLAILNLDHP